MKESYWGYWLVMLGILVIGVMLLISSTTTGTTEDYYELKETASASVIDAVDYSYYRLYGDLKISKEKFIENFIRRFSESATMTKEYNISFYDISEVPPKVSIKISSVSNSVNIANTTNNSFDLVNKIDMILVGGSPGTPDTGKTNKGSIKHCIEYSVTPEFAHVIQNVLNDGQTADVGEELAKRMLNANLSELKKWASKKGDLSNAGTDYFNEFTAALLLDFSSSFGRSTEDDFIEADPTRPSNTALTTENRTSGILGLAIQKGWLNKVGAGS